jgi:hypothetical protein
MTYDQLLVTARACEGEWLETKTGRRFRVGVALDCPFFTPESSGLGRSDGRKAAEAFVERFNETHSLRIADYTDVTRNASYFIPLALRAEDAGI